ncbi:tyrosine-type recombinase/integrase [Roseateles terrae]|uniref:Integrase n=1 Tax=Roseateles terrae TaxID=431060 RepID=A0ABR6GL73_9BURK|nr:site-specific integrase [Roseateles terrae]MBB3192851.1 integrase [Roseateles terrae]
MARHGPPQGFPTYSRTFERQRDAQAWATDVEAAIGRRDLAEVRRLTATGDKLGGSIADLVDKYVIDVLPSRGQAKSEKPRLARIKDALGKLTVPMLTAQDVAKWRDARLKEGASVGTVRHDLNTLSKLLGHAVSEWGVEGLRNVVRDVKKPVTAKGRDRRIAELELEYLLHASTYTPPDRPDEAPARGLSSLITLAVESSMRLGELIGLDWKHVDFKNRTAHLPKTKNGEARTVALSSKAAAALQALRNGKKVQTLDGKVFDWTRSDSVSHPFRRCVKRAIALYKADCVEGNMRPLAGFLADVRFHDLRHEATSRLFEKGLNPMEVASMTGHKSMQMLKR